MIAARLLAVPLVAAALAAGGCGESDEDQARDKVCGARASIGEQVDTLKSLTPATVTVDGVQQSLKTIGDDLSEIKDAQADLSDERRDEVQAANRQFESQVQDIVGSLGASLSVSAAKTQLTAALQELAGAYEQTIAKIDC